MLKAMRSAMGLWRGTSTQLPIGLTDEHDFATEHYTMFKNAVQAKLKVIFTFNDDSAVGRDRGRNPCKNYRI